MKLIKRHRVWFKFKKRCAYCGCNLEYKDMQVDHIIPKRRGDSDKDLIKYNLQRGSNSLENLNPSCVSCNSSKSTFPIEDWRRELELKTMRLQRDSSTFRILLRFGLVSIRTNRVKFYFEQFKN